MRNGLLRFAASRRNVASRSEQDHTKPTQGTTGRENEMRESNQNAGKADVLAVIWPERRNVSAATMLLWAQDAYANNEVDRAPDDAADAAALLHEAGLITLGGAR